MAESAGAAAPAAGTAKRMKRESPPAPALQADKAATAVRQADEEMALRVADPDLITAQVIKLIERNDGKVTDLRQAAGTRIIHVELDASRLEALVKEFGKLGSVERIRKAAGSVGRITMKLTLGSKQ